MFFLDSCHDYTSNFSIASSVSTKRDTSPHIRYHYPDWTNQSRRKHVMNISPFFIFNIILFTLMLLVFFLMYRRSLHNHLNAPQKTLRYYEDVLEHQRKVGDRTGEATTLNKIGMHYNALGQFDEALNFFNDALLIRHEIGERSDEAATLNNIGSVYRGLDKPQEALRFYNKSLAISRERGDRSGEAITLSNIGLVYGGLGQSEEALRYYNESLSIRCEIGDGAGEALTRYNISKIYWEQRDLISARAELQNAVKLTDTVQSPYRTLFQKELAVLEEKIANN
jgi:tetratricopeptide (TPR) repeat protein